MSDSVTSINALRLDLFRVTSGQAAHAAADTPIATPAATDLPSLVVLANALSSSFNDHVPNLVDAISGFGVHGLDSGDRVTVPAATDFASARTLLNDLETQLQQHARTAGAHLAPQLLTVSYFEANGALSEVCNHANSLWAQINTHYASALNSGVSA